MTLSIFINFGQGLYYGLVHFNLIFTQSIHYSLVYFNLIFAQGIYYSLVQIFIKFLPSDPLLMKLYFKAYFMPCPFHFCTSKYRTYLVLLIFCPIFMVKLNFYILQGMVYRPYPVLLFM